MPKVGGHLEEMAHLMAAKLETTTLGSTSASRCVFSYRVSGKQLDEPTANLSPLMARLVLEETVPALARDGVTVLVVEQRAREVLAVADWAYVMAGGTVALADAASTILARPDLGEVFLGRVAQDDGAQAGAIGRS